MKKLKLLLFLSFSLFLLISMSFISLRSKDLMRNVSAQNSNESYPVSYSGREHVKNRYNVKMIKNIYFNINDVNDYTFYKDEGNILISGSFLINDDNVDITVYKKGTNYTNLYSWINENYGPFIFNEKRLAKTLNTKNEVNETNSVVTSVSGDFFYTRFRVEEDNIIAYTILINQKSIDWKRTKKLLLFKNRSWQINVSDILSDLNKKKEKLENNLNQENSVQQQTQGLSPTYTTNTVSSNYYLPWEKGSTYQITQDWCANDAPGVPCTSHSGMAGYAYDFGIPEGTDILASDAGTVTFVQGSYSACGGISYINLANYVVIKHADGKSTLYLHLKNTSVTVGTSVSRGQIIGKSGKVGYTATSNGGACGPHLHFQKEFAGTSYWTQSEAIIFHEYPNQPGDGEIQYGTNITSQNTLTTNNECGGYDVQKNNWNVTGPLDCHALHSIRITPNSTLNPGSGTIRLHVP
jgi:murein DD-endopeptidase MepM/ murein hydrolase activator NlpD